jgi:hypothetical protein
MLQVETSSLSPATSNRRAFFALTIFDFFSMLAVSAVLLYICIALSHSRILWPDEVYARELTLDPSFAHMLAAWSQGVDGGGILYYIACRLWLNLVGFSELKLRLFSCFGIILAFNVIWAAARRYFSIIPVAFAAALVFLTSSCLIWQDFNGRFYGMYLAAAALCAMLFLYTAEKESLTTLDLLLVCLAHTLLVGTQVLGVLYSAGILLAMIAFDRLWNRFRPRLYLAAAASWLFLLISIRGVLALTAIAKGHFWTLKPAVRNLLDPDFGFNPLVAQCFKWLLVAAAILWFATGRRKPQSSVADVLRSHPWLFLLSALAFAELLIFAKSKFGVSIWSDRYLIPLQISAVFLLAAAASSVWSLSAPLGPVRHLLIVGAAALIVVKARPAIANPLYAFVFPDAGMPQRLQAMLPPGHEIVMAAANDFFILRTYDPSHHYLFLSDWAYNDAPIRADGNYAIERMMNNWKSAGYLAPGDLATCETFYQGPASLTLVMDSAHEQWMKDRLIDNPAFDLQKVGSFDEWSPVTLWTVRRVGNPGPCK